MRRLAVLSLHTSPLAQPGTGDGGGMNVYVRELASALARTGVECDVFTRAWSADLAPDGDRRARAPGPSRPGRGARPPAQGAPREGRARVHRAGARRHDRRQRPRAAVRDHPRQLLALGPGRPHHQARARPAPGVHVPHARPGEGRGRTGGGGGRPGPPAGRGRGDDHRLLGRRAGLVHRRGRPDRRPLRGRPGPHPGRAARGRPRLLRARRPAPGPAGPGPAARRDPARCSWAGSSP